MPVRSTPLRPANRSPRRAALLLLCCLALLAGSLDLHAFLPHAGAAHHGAFPGPLSVGTAEEMVLGCAASHGRRTHLETVPTAEVDHCSACLQRLQTRAGGSSAPGPLAVPVTRLVVASSPRAARHPALEQAPSRGPPAA